MRRALVAALALVATVTAPAAAQAKITASASVVADGGGSRIVVVLRSSTALPARKRPKAVRVTANGATFALTRAAGRVTGTRLGTWRSAVLRGIDLSGATLRVRITPRRGDATTVGATIPAAATTPGATTPIAPAPTPTPAGTPPVATNPAGAKVTLTRNDAAGQTALAGGDLLLEQYKFGSTGLTADYIRIWFYASGQFRLNTIAWNSVSGESCTDVKTGAWTFKEAYTFTEGGGGVIVKIGLTGALNGDEVLSFGNAEPNNVYVGQQFLKFERNPNMQQNCG